MSTLIYIHFCPLKQSPAAIPYPNITYKNGEVICQMYVWIYIYVRLGLTCNHQIHVRFLRHRQLYVLFSNSQIGIQFSNLWSFLTFSNPWSFSIVTLVLVRQILKFLLLRNQVPFLLLGNQWTIGTVFKLLSWWKLPLWCAHVHYSYF